MGEEARITAGRSAVGAANTSKQGGRARAQQQGMREGVERKQAGKARGGGGGNDDHRSNV
jgi:hypothetical protein